MSNDFGTGTSRVLDPNQASMLQVIWQQGKPPLDAELNFLQQLSEDWRRTLVLRGTPSGWLSNAVNTEEDFVTGATWSNWLRYGLQKTGEKRAVPWAVVNGWLVPVTGTGTGSPPGSPNDTDTWNKLALDPPPSNSGDSRIDFVFLEVWMARVPPNPSTLNKPSSSGIWRYGNVEGGYTFITDDIQDPAIGFETTQRVQLQSRIRVVSGLVGLTSYPDGFDPTVVKGRGGATADTSYTFENMREELGDEGLWRAGDGTSNALGTVDGYVYAVPLCAIFRRNSVAWDGDPGQNLNGAFNRNPTAVDASGATIFSTTPTLNGALTDTALTLDLASVADIPLPLTPATSVTIQVGDEIMTYSAITGSTMTIASRGALGTKAEAHYAGDAITVLAGRPDALFSDQIAKTDILDLRHAVNPNGFNYETLLKSNLDKLLRGQMRSTWKRSGGGPQGAFVFYQDKVSASAAALGVTLLDAPDGHRTVFSDAAMQQSMEFVAKLPIGKSTSEDITTTWDLSLSGTVNNNVAGVAAEYNPQDVITIPVVQLKTGLPGGDADQVRFISDAGAVSIRIDGEQFSLVEGTHFSVTAITDPADDLVITLEADFPANTVNALYISFHVQWGSGRGISRRPDALHSVSYLSAGSNIMIQQAGVPADNTPMRTSWALLWSKYRDDLYHNLLPVTAEAYADIGSKTTILTPFRRIVMPDDVRVLDGTNANINWDESPTAGTVGSTSGSATFTDGTKNFTTLLVVEGDAVVVESPASVAGTYYVSATIGTTTFDIDGIFPATASNIVYSIYHTQGLMPTDDITGSTKWTTTDPMSLFSGSQGGLAAEKNLYVPLPRKLVPGWGEIRVPILHTDTATFSEGINYLFLTSKGARSQGTNFPEINYVSFNNNSPSYVPFSTLDLNTDLPVTYQGTFSYSGKVHCGIRFFTDSRSMGRKGLELPPFYGIARLFAVYEAQDYKTNGSAYKALTREAETTGTPATNLLRQNFDGSMFWVEIDDDGDSTFILNAEALDLAKSPNAIPSFENGDYVVESCVFGFDRNAFENSNECRIVLARERGTGQADNVTRAENFGQTGANAAIASPALIVPGPPIASDEIAINYSRTPYQGDAWGSQTSQQDISHQRGPLLTSTIYQLISTELNEDSLTRPNQKAIEVLASVGFLTTLGTGRLSGDLHPSVYDFRNIGYEDHSTFPPTSGSDPRPEVLISAIASDEADDLGSMYHGCTERLPMGALYRDKDFRGGFVHGDFTGQVRSPLVYTNTASPGVSSASIAVNQSFDQDVINASTSTLASGQPGELVVHMDGEQGNYGLLTNFRTHRGGSAFSATPPWPGGELETRFVQGGGANSYDGVLAGTAYLVRNAVTSIGATEVSAGAELMMLISTTALRLSGAPRNLFMFLGSNGTGEGYSASDLYRVGGHPLVRDNVRVDLDPASYELARKTDRSFEV